MLRNFIKQMQYYNCFSNTLLLVFLSMLFVSCTGDTEDLKQKFKEVAARKGRPIEPLPEFKPLPKFAYPTHLKRRNPFFQYKQVVKPTKADLKQRDINAPNLKRAKQPLENYKIGDLKMVGMLRQNGLTWGLVISPDNKVHKVTIGSYLGKNYGRVILISADRIRIVEKYKDSKIWKKRDVNLTINGIREDYVSPSSIKEMGS